MNYSPGSYLEFFFTVLRKEGQDFWLLEDGGAWPPTPSDSLFIWVTNCLPWVRVEYVCHYRCSGLLSNDGSSKGFGGVSARPHKGR